MAPRAQAVVIGSGPNGLSAAIVLAQAGYSVLVREARETIGGSARSAALTLPGFLHDTGSAVYPLGISSPFFRTLGLSDFGLEWIQPPAPLAHPLDDGTAVLLERSVEAAARGLARDAQAYRNLVVPLLKIWDGIEADVLGSLRIPRQPLALARFGLLALRSCRALVFNLFEGDRARALFAGLCAHSMLPLDMRPSAAFGLVLGITGHSAGWPFARGGAQSITNALAARLRSLGGRIETSAAVNDIDECAAELVLCDLTPREFLRIAGHRLPRGFRKKLEGYRYGMGAFKMDWALDGPIPWTAKECLRAGTVHLGGTLEELAESERAAWEGRHAEKPFVLLAQPSLFDASRAPEGKHTAWAYCHVPNGSAEDMTERIEAQVERFAPGFRNRVLARSVMPPAELERNNANLAGGDINGGAPVLSQLFLRPTARLYATPLPHLFLCSASTPPGGGVHGMCGYYAARAALRETIS